MEWARNGILSDDGCATPIERSTTKGNARTSRALGRRPVGGGLEEAFDLMSILVVPLAATCACAHRRSQRSRGVLGGLTEFGSIRVAGEFLCATEARE